MDLHLFSIHLFVCLCLYRLIRLCPEKNGNELEALREFRLRLQPPPDAGSSVRISLTPPIAATTERLSRDSNRAWELIRTLGKDFVSRV